jgi:glycosyltransferase involved in cell wall biosynthesis
MSKGVLQSPHSSRRTVVFVETAAAMGGVQFSTLYLVQQLDPALWQSIVVCPEAGPLTDGCLRSNIRVQIIDRPKLLSTSVRLGKSVRWPNPLAWTWDGWAMLVAARRLARCLEKVRPDLVVTKGLFAHFYGGLAARRVSVPCVWHVQDLISDRNWGIYRWIFGQSVRWLPDLIVADGAAIARQLPRSVQDRISVVHNGVDPTVFQPGMDGSDVRRGMGIPTDALIIGHVARMTPWKGQQYLVEAFAKLARQIPNAYLLLVGAPVFDHDKYEHRLRNLTSKLGLDNRVVFSGYRHDLPQVLAAMDVFAFTSVEKDTSPLALLSAMSSGLPIVAFDIEGVRELLKADEQFLAVPVRQVEALAQALIRVLSDDRLRERLSAAARRQAEAEFSLDRYVSRMEEVFLRAGRREQLVAGYPRVTPISQI